MNFADQLLFLDFVVNLRFLSARKGPTMETSTKGRNIPDVCHFMSFAAMTGWRDVGTREREKQGEHMRQIQVQYWTYKYMFVVACVYIYIYTQYINVHILDFMCSICITFCLF